MSEYNNQQDLLNLHEEGFSNNQPTEEHHQHEHHQQPAAQPSAPTHSDETNGFIFVPPTQQTSVDSSNMHEKVNEVLSKEGQEEISKLLVDISDNTNKPVVAEADSSSSSANRVTRKENAGGNTIGSIGSALCPYYFLACNYVTKVQIPPKVQDLLLWKDPKKTGAVFGSSFVLLLALSLFSFLTVVSSLLLLALTVIGSYRFYLALVFRIKGVHDPIFDKLSEFDLSLPKDKVKELAHLLENDVNKVLNQAKSVLLWDNIVTSSLTYLGLYVVYCIGSVFNTLTLFILALVSLFTLPKIYQVYKKPIDQAVMKATDSVHLVVRQVIAKVPFLNKKKTQ